MRLREIFLSDDTVDEKRPASPCPQEVLGNEAVDEDIDLGPLTPKQAWSRSKKMAKIAKQERDETARHQSKVKAIRDRKQNA